jgi:hypothetical protein
LSVGSFLSALSIMSSLAFLGLMASKKRRGKKTSL